MRSRWATWLVVAALGAIGLAAAVDALREEPLVRTTSAPDRAEETAEAAARLREAGASGVLTYSDEDCRLHAVSLPDLETVRAPSFEMCRPATSTGELGVFEGDVVWAGLGYGVAQVVLSQEDLSRAVVGQSPGSPPRFRAVQAVSLDEERMLVLAEAVAEPEERILAAFDGPRAEFAHLSLGADGARAVRSSPAGGFFAVFRADPPAVRLFTRDGRDVTVPAEVPPARAVAWSPDDRWTAVVTADGVYVFAPGRPQDGVIRIPVDALDLDWSETGFAAGP